MLQNVSSDIRNTKRYFDNKVRELIAVKALHTPLLNITVVAFKVVPLGSTDASA
jgi:hypothetical protein